MRWFRSVAPACLLLALAAAALAVPQPAPGQDSPPSAPAFPGMPPPQAPADNPTTPERIELGRHLFFDSRLSGPGYMSCGTCHRPELAFSDGRPVAIGITGQYHPRNTPGLANVGYFPVLTWADPAETALETQSIKPLFGHEPVEMMSDVVSEIVLDRLTGDASYRRMFAAAFPETGGIIDFPTIRLAIAAFERTLISAGSPYDNWLADPVAALSPEAARGLALFMSPRFGCADCHAPPFFTDMAFHNTGLFNLDGDGGLPLGNQGLVAHSGDPADMGRFRTPSLRNVAVTGPYMHDGSVESLEAAIEAYAAGGRAALAGARSPLTSPLVAGFRITAGEKADLLAFLGALTDTTFMENEAFQSPFRYRPAAGQGAEQRGR